MSFNSPNDYSLPASVLAMQKAIMGVEVGGRTLRQFQRPGEDDRWLATDALAYAFLGIPVLKGEVVDNLGEIQDVEDSNEAEWVCLSPNSHEIFKPALGLRSPRLFGDGCYGFDDRARWPQMYSSKFEYFACIPRYSAERSVLWRPPTRLGCIPIPGAFDREVCLLNPNILAELKAQCDECCESVWKAMKTEKGHEPALLVTHLLETLDRLAMGLSYRNVIQNVGELQRTCLDLLGWVNFVTIFLPRTFICNSQDNKVYDVDPTVMGAFTHSIPVAQRLFRIGIPVYLILSSTKLPANMNVKSSSATTLRSTSMGGRAPDIVTEDFMTINHGPYPFPVLTHKFPGAHLQEALQRFSIQVSVRRQSAVGATVEGAVEREVVNEPGSAMFLPFIVYKLSQDPGSRSNAGPVPRLSMATAADPKLLDVQMIPSWCNALERYESGTYGKGSSVELKGTVLPAPTLFDPGNDGKSKNTRVYAAVYISLRPAYLATIINDSLATGQPQSFPSGQQWRNFLITFKKCIPIPDGVHIRTEPQKAKKKRSAQVFGVPGNSSKRPRPAATGPVNIPSSSWMPSSSALLSSPPTNAAVSTPSSSSSIATTLSPNPSSPIPAPELISTPPAGGKRRFHPLHQSLPPLQNVSQISWLDKKILVQSLPQIERDITDDILSEVRWDVHEQNFRLELLMLDQVLCPGLWRVGEDDLAEVRSARKTRELALRRVFPLNGQVHENFFVQAIPNVDGGVASRDWSARIPFFLAFREVVLAWPDCPDLIVKSSSYDTKHALEMEAVENMIVREYCSRFLRHFGRLPIPPVRLPFASLSRQSPATFYTSLPSEDIEA